MYWDVPETPVSTMWYLLNIPSIRTQHRCVQAREYLRINTSEDRPLKTKLHNPMAHASRVVDHEKQKLEKKKLDKICRLEKISMGADCMKTQMSHLTRVHIGWSRECHDWVTIRVDSEVKEQIKKYSNLEDHIIHTNGLVIYGTMRECGFGVYLREAFTATAAGAFTITTTIKHENGDRSGHTDHHIAGKAASKISHNPNRLTDFAQKN